MGTMAQRTISATVLRSTGIGAATCTALMIPAMLARMNGREEIEWQDPSWEVVGAQRTSRGGRLESGRDNR